MTAPDRPQGDEPDPPDFSNSLRWGSEYEATLKAPSFDFILGQTPIPDCPSCGRKRKEGERVMVTADNGAKTLWEGCWGCVADRLTMTPERILRVVTRLIATKRETGFILVNQGQSGQYPMEVPESDSEYAARLLSVGLEALGEERRAQ